MTEPRPPILAGVADFMRDRLHLAKALILALLTTACIGAYFSGCFDSADKAFWDFCFRHRPVQYTSPKIVIVEIDEDAIRSVGRWPWDREWHATLIQALKEFGARSIALDMVFAESTDPGTDALLAKVIQKSGLTHLPIAFEKVEGREGIGSMRSLPLIASGARGEGHAYTEPDRDGVLREAHAWVEERGKRIWHLGILLALEFWGAGPADVRVDGNRIQIPISGNPPLQFFTNTAGRIQINWPARWRDSFRHVSYVDVIHSYSARLKGEKPEIDPNLFKDAICLVGITASGLFDIHATPLESAYPTVGVTASVLNSFIERSFLTPLPRSRQAAVMLLISAVLLIIMMRTGYLRALILIAALGTGYTITAYLAFTRGNLAMSLVYPSLLILSGYAALAGYHQMMILIEKNRLLKLATTDPLTGLFNVAHFKRLLQAELQSTRLRVKKDICLVMADGDYFKKVNDTHGHAVGDEVLRGLSDVLRANCRALDVAARYGGEEFIVMLPGATLEAGLSIAEKMRLGIEQKKYSLGSGKPPIGCTASFGVAAYAPGETMEDFLKRADEALYLAKKTGRNCVCTL